MSAAEQISALECTYRAADKAEIEAATVKAKVLEEIALLRQSSGIITTADDVLKVMSAAGIFYAWKRSYWQTLRLSRKTEKGLAPVVEQWLHPWLRENVAVDATRALVADVLKVDAVKWFPVSEFVADNEKVKP